MSCPRPALPPRGRSRTGDRCWHRRRPPDPACRPLRLHNLRLPGKILKLNTFFFFFKINALNCTDRAVTAVRGVCASSRRGASPPHPPTRVQRPQGPCHGYSPANPVRQTRARRCPPRQPIPRQRLPAAGGWGVGGQRPGRYLGSLVPAVLRRLLLAGRRVLAGSPRRRRLLLLLLAALGRLPAAGEEAAHGAADYRRPAGPRGEAGSAGGSASAAPQPRLASPPRPLPLSLRLP